MRKIYKLLVVLLSVVIFLTGCGCNNGNIVVEKEAKRKPSTGKKWTVMIYMSASALEDKYGRLGEVLASLSYDLPKNINVVVEVGGCNNGWNIEGIKNDKLQDFAVQKNGIRPIHEEKLKNMGDANTYAEFLKRTIKKYPADRYVSVIWGDGGGAVNGVAHDPMYKYDALTTVELSKALKKTGTKLDIIGFDAGMMSGIETASAIAPYADYMIASEDVMPISGWDYREFFKFISNNPGSSVKEAGKAICDGVANDLKKENEHLLSMAVVDLSKIPQIVEKFKTATWNMKNACEDMSVLREMIARINLVPVMGASAVWEGSSETIDLLAFTKAIDEATYFNSEMIEKEISSAVVYKTMSETHSASCGLNVYYPKTYSQKEIERYKDISISADYDEYIEKINTYSVAQNREFSPEETNAWKEYTEVSKGILFNAETDFAGKYLLSASRTDTFVDIGVNLYKYDEEEGVYVHLGTDKKVSYNNMTNTYENDIRNTFVELNGIPVDIYLVNKTGNTETYSIPVIYKGVISSIRVQKTPEDSEEGAVYKVLGLWDGIGAATGIAYRQYKMPEVGETITPIYAVFGSDEEYIEGKSFTLVIGGLTVKEKPLKDGQYIITYTADDLYGRHTESKPSNATAMKGKLQISQ